MGGPRWAGVSGPLEGFEGGFAAWLVERGYMPPAVQLQRRLTGELSLWLTAEGLGLADLSRQEIAGRFIAARRAAGVKQHVTGKSLVPLLEFLGSVGVIEGTDPEPVTDPVEVMLERFAGYLRRERGLGDGTIVGYVAAVLPFVARQAAEGTVDLSRVTPAEVTEFIVAACPGRPPGPAKVIVTAMRSFLRWLHLEGTLAVPLAGAVPSVASRRLARLPDPLKPAQVRALLGACDRKSRVGRRDYAMIMLLWRLGLRAGEVARLGLGDIDWRAGELVVCGKGPRIERLPLPDDAGEAVAAWLQRGRPSTAIGRTVFVRLVAPHGALSSTGVTQAVYAVGQRAGLGTVRAHRLRHTAASSMLAAGVTLPDIGQVLRHQRILTSAIYAKVDVSALRHVAAPWPGSAQ